MKRFLMLCLITTILGGGLLIGQDYSELIGTWKISHHLEGRRYTEFITVTEVAKEPLGEHKNIDYIYQVKAKISDYVLLRGDIINDRNGNKTKVVLCESFPQMMVLAPYMTGIYFRMWCFKFTGKKEIKKGKYMVMVLGRNKDNSSAVVVQRWWHNIQVQKIN